MWVFEVSDNRLKTHAELLQLPSAPFTSSFPMLQTQKVFCFRLLVWDSKAYMVTSAVSMSETFKESLFLFFADQQTNKQGVA